MTRSDKPLLWMATALALSACAGKPVVKPQPADGEVTTVTTPSSTPAKPAAPVAEVKKDPATQFEEALAALKSKDLAKARVGFALLAKEHPEFSGPLTNLAILDAKANAKPAAIAGFTRAIAANPRNAIAFNWLGILYRESKDYARAEQSYLKAIELNPAEASYVLNLGILNDLYLKRPEEALKHYRDYQRMTSNRELKVAAWIKALEAASPAPAIVPPTSPAPAATTGATKT